MAPLEPERIERAYFWATPINSASPSLCRAVYLITREGGQWVYRLQPGSLEIAVSQGAFSDEEALKKSNGLVPTS
jgi:hypothetical protein